MFTGAVWHKKFCWHKTLSAYTVRWSPNALGLQYQTLCLLPQQAGPHRVAFPQCQRENICPAMKQQRDTALQLDLCKRGTARQNQAGKNQLGMIWVCHMSGNTAKWVSSYLTCDCNLLGIVVSENLFTKGRCLNYSWGSFGCETLHINLSKNTVKRGIMGTPVMNAWQPTSVIFVT